MLVLKSNQLIVKTWFDKEGKVHAVERIKKRKNTYISNIYFKIPFTTHTKIFKKRELSF